MNVGSMITSGSALSNGFYGTTDHRTATLIIAYTKATIHRITKEPDSWKRRLWFDKKDAEIVLDLWIHNKPIMVDVRDVFYALDAVNAAMHSELEIGT